MSTLSNATFEINGVIDTGDTILNNLNELCSAAGCWLSYDIAQGKWAVVINKTGTSVASFNDTNIIGGINISSTGLTELYNSVEIQFPHKDLNNEKDYISLSIADGDRYPNEQENILQIQTELLNDPIQAELLASRQLKQSRIDKVIDFRTDFSKLGLKAGDLIDVTNTPYNFSSKVFRIISIQEDDADDGVLSLSIKALEYNADVYSTAGLTYNVRTLQTGITTLSNNPAVKSSANQSAIIQGQPQIFSFVTGYIKLNDTSSQQTDFGWVQDFDDATLYASGYGITLPYTGRYKVTYYLNCAAFWNYTGTTANLPTTVRKRFKMNIRNSAGRIDTNSLIDSTTVLKGEDALADMNLVGVFYGTKGTAISFNFNGKVNFGPTSASAAGYSGASAGVYLSGELFYLGN
jgi:hypothetical protein